MSFQNFDIKKLLKMDPCMNCFKKFRMQGSNLCYLCAMKQEKSSNRHGNLTISVQQPQQHVVYMRHQQSQQVVYIRPQQSQQVVYVRPQQQVVYVRPQPQIQVINARSPVIVLGPGVQFH